MTQAQMQHLARRVAGATRSSLWRMVAPLEGMTELARLAGVKLPESDNDDSYRGGLTGEILPAGELETLTVADLTVLRRAVSPTRIPAHVSMWSEKLLRVLEIRVNDLPQRLARNCPDQASAAVFVLCALTFLLEVHRVTGDLRMVNLALKIRDLGWINRVATYARPEGRTSAGLLLRALLVTENALAELRRDSGRPPVQRARGDGRFLSASDDLLLTGTQPRIVVIAPSRYSLVSLTVAELCAQSGVRVEGFVVRRLINGRRFIDEFRRDRSRFMRKVWRKAVLREKMYGREEPDNLVKFRQQHGFVVGCIDDLAKHMEVPIFYCYELNESVVVEFLKRTSPDLVLFTGGGLIRRDVLCNSGLGVLNCHMGVLPRYRGMDVVEWPVLEGRIDDVGITVHLMDEGVDTGDVLTVQDVQVKDQDNFSNIRDRFEPVMCRALVHAACAFFAGRLHPIPQVFSDGRQYFRMHRDLMRIASERLCNQHGEVLELLGS